MVNFARKLPFSRHPSDVVSPTPTPSAMSILVEPRSGGPIWRKRHVQGLDGPEVKRRRFAHVQLEPDRSSDEDTESLSSLQEKETDYVKDTSEPESETSEQSSTDEYEVEVTYEVDSNENSSDVSSPESDMMVAVAAAMICNKPLDAWITDDEDADYDPTTSMDEDAYKLQKFVSCLLCNTKNSNPLYRYCKQCFQERKSVLPARPLQKRRRVKANTYKSDEIAVLKAYQSAHSQDSGLGLSEEKATYGLEPITVYRTGPSASLTRVSENLSQRSKSRSKKRKLVKKAGLKRKRPFFENSISEFKAKRLKLLRKPDKTLLEEADLKLLPEPDETSLGGAELKLLPKADKTPPERSELKLLPKPAETSLEGAELKLLPKADKTPLETPEHKLLSKPDKTPLDGSELVPCTIETILTSEKLQLELPIDSRKESIASSQPKKPTETRSLIENGQADLTDESELCILCNSAPKDSIFVHGKNAHHCSCYPCAKRTFISIGRCPLCNAGLENVLQMF